MQLGLDVFPQSDSVLWIIQNSKVGGKGYEVTQIHLKNKFEENPANPSMFSRAKKVPNEINKSILKSIIKNTAILEYSLKNGSYVIQRDKFSNVHNLKGLT